MLREQPSLFESLTESELTETPPAAHRDGYVARAIVEDADLGFFTSHDESAELVSDDNLEQLVNIYLRASEQRDAHIVLVWPGTFSSVPFVHAAACFGLWANGYKKGVRGLYYPAKRNSFYPLNHVQVSRTRLIKLANKILEPLGKEKNDLIKEGLPDKDAFLFAVNAFRTELSEASLRPCINELIPHFSIEKPGQKFEDYSSRFFFRLKHNAWLRQRRALMQTTFPALGFPANAPDALFALGYALRNPDIDEALHAFRKLNSPSVIMLDATWRNIKSIPDWRQRFVTFIKKIRKVFVDDCPGIVLVTDEPRQLALFRVLLANAYKDTPRLGHMNAHGIVRTYVNLGLRNPEKPTLLHMPKGDVRVLVTDFEMGMLIEEFTACAQRLEHDSKDATPIWQAVAFLGKLSHLPGNLTQLWAYLDKLSLTTSARESFNWQYYRGNLLAFIAEGHAGGERAALEKAMAITSKLVEAHHSNTPLGLKIISEVRRAHEKGVRASIVVRRKLHKSVLEAYLVNSKLNLDTVSVVQAEELDVILDLDRAVDVLIFADMSPQIMRMVVAEPRLPKEVVLLLTAPMAKHMKYNIMPLMRMVEFEVFHSRLQTLLTPLEQQFEVNNQSFLKDDGLVLPTFKVSSYEADDPSIEDRDAVLIALDDHVIRRGTHSLMYVYDPVAADNGYSGFRSITADHLEPGQQVFLMSSELRELIEKALENCGVKVGADTPFEVGLRNYHARVTAQLNKHFNGTHSAQVRLLKDRVLQIDSSVESEIHNLAHWVNLGHSPDTPFEKLAPQAPRRFKPFKAFCKALEIPEEEVRFFWEFVIKPLRGSRRKEGRWLSDVYARILFDSDSAMAYKGLMKSTIDDLRRMATENIFAVSEVILPEKKEE